MRQISIDAGGGVNVILMEEKMKECGFGERGSQNAASIKECLYGAKVREDARKIKQLDVKFWR